MGLDKVLEKWNWAKREEAAMKKIIKKCKTEVESKMLKAGVDKLSTARYAVSKSQQSRSTSPRKTCRQASGASTRRRRPSSSCTSRRSRARPRQKRRRRARRK